MKKLAPYLLALSIGIGTGYFLRGKLEPCPPQTVIKADKIKQKGKNNKQDTKLEYNEKE